MKKITRGLKTSLFPVMNKAYASAELYGLHPLFDKMVWLIVFNATSSPICSVITCPR
jgi:hypothetical protein